MCEITGLFPAPGSCSQPRLLKSVLCVTTLTPGTLTHRDLAPRPPLKGCLGSGPDSAWDCWPSADLEVLLNPGILPRLVFPRRSLHTLRRRCPLPRRRVPDTKQEVPRTTEAPLTFCCVELANQEFFSSLARDCFRMKIQVQASKRRLWRSKKTGRRAEVGHGLCSLG